MIDPFSGTAGTIRSHHDARQYSLRFKRASQDTDFTRVLSDAFASLA